MHADNPAKARRYFAPLIHEYDAVVLGIEESLAEFERMRKVEARNQAAIEAEGTINDSYKIELPRAGMGLTLPTYTEVLQMRKSLDRMKEKGGAADGRQQQEQEYGQGATEPLRAGGRWAEDFLQHFYRRDFRMDRERGSGLSTRPTDAESHRADRQRAEETRHYTQIGKRGYEYQGYGQGAEGQLQTGVGRWDGDDARIFEQRRYRMDQEGGSGLSTEPTDAESHRADRQRAEETRHYTQIGKRGYEYQEVKAESAAANAKEALDYWRSLGLNCAITDGVLWTEGPEGRKKDTGWEAKKLPDGTLLINNNANLSAVEISRHEVIHAMRTLAPKLFYKAYRVLEHSGMDVVRGQKTISKIVEAYEKSHPDFAALSDLSKFQEEILALFPVCMQIIQQRQREVFAPLIHEYDAVVLGIEESLAEFERMRKVEARNQAAIEAEGTINDSYKIELPRAGMGLTLPTYAEVMKSRKLLEGNVSDLDIRMKRHYENMVNNSQGTIDAAKYPHLGQEFAQAAFELGVTPQELEAIEKIAKATGTKYKFANLGFGEKLGYYDRGEIVLNRFNLSNPILEVLAHELTHHAEQGKGYRQLRQEVLYSEHFERMMGGRSLAQVREETRERYKDYNRTAMAADSSLTIEELTDREVFAQAMEQMIYDEELIEEIAKKRPAFVQSVIDLLNKILDALRGAGEYERFVRDVQSRFKRALYDAKAGENGAQFRIEMDSNGDNIVVINGNIFEGTNQNIPKYKMVRDFIKRHIGEFYQIAQDGNEIYLGKDLPGEYTQSKYTQNLRNKNVKTLNIKFQAAQNLDELIQIAQNGEWTQNRKQKHAIDAKNGWYKYQTRFAIPVKNSDGNFTRYNIYNADLIIRHDVDGKKYLYDVMGIKKNLRQ